VGMAVVSNWSEGYWYPDRVDLLILFWNYTAEPTIYWEQNCKWTMHRCNQVRSPGQLLWYT
jgi:hypothetical protein